MTHQNGSRQTPRTQPREGIFSGLNNVRVYSVVDPEFATAFGFTEPEVAHLCAALGRPDLLDDLRRAYDGYRFGGHAIYNPWSVLSFAERPEQGFKPYWVQTSTDDILRELVLERGYPVLDELGQLLRGESLTREVNEHISLRDLGTSPQALWSVLLLSGYVTARRSWLEEGRLFAELAIPNQELRYVFEQSIASWLSGTPAGEGRLDRMLSAMLTGDTETFAALLSQLALRVLSHHDTGTREPETVYQAFLVGMLVRLLPSHEVTSNRESGLGCYDLLVAPRAADQPGVVLELKVATGTSEEAVRRALGEALAQVTEKRYVEALHERGAKPALAYAVACHGKQVWVQKEGEPAVHGAGRWRDDEEAG
ncbi:PD-(D/E)XK nuclease domain-containing protein [Chondromyces apiculatus]|uniref:Protein with a weak D-galactarate dehydratase/altronate hydrolase domain protein n=1 Tax=Chondromyces apiculatus DSM 436 TaxID=1192034 RepID=A0A017SZ31_9BACT|nr:PD-(D/E)XK nuclease domain-containing protein [Chondromyces apiculatus]EYF01875.1 protein with a weak D-galactarate dehydratase/altronate hydrolase domain protein [Chondromyces apiculatus DSM 436]